MLRLNGNYTSSGDNPPPPKDVELCKYHEICKYHSSAKCNSCQNNTYKEQRKSYYKRIK